MKPKTFKKKLVLNKSTISDLNDFQQLEVKAAGMTPETPISWITCIQNCTGGDLCTNGDCTWAVGCDTFIGCTTVVPVFC